MECRVAREQPGLTTGLIPGGPARAFQMDIDLLTHQIEIMRADGERRVIALEPRSVADFYGEVAPGSTS